MIFSDICGRNVCLCFCRCLFRLVFMFIFVLCLCLFLCFVFVFVSWSFIQWSLISRLFFLSLSSSVFVCTQTPISRLLRQHMLGVLCIRNLKFNVFVFIFVIDFCFCLHLCH